MITKIIRISRVINTWQNSILQGAVCEKAARTDLRGSYEATHISTHLRGKIKP